MTSEPRPDPSDAPQPGALNLSDSLRGALADEIDAALDEPSLRCRCGELSLFDVDTAVELAGMKHTVQICAPCDTFGNFLNEYDGPSITEVAIPLGHVTTKRLLDELEQRLAPINPDARYADAALLIGHVRRILPRMRLESAPLAERSRTPRSEQDPLANYRQHFDEIEEVPAFVGVLVGAASTC